MKRKTPRRAKAKPQHTDVTVKAAFDACPAPARRQLLTLRKLIHDTARTTEGVGPLDEALKWGQVSFLTNESKSGSTIRIDRVKGDDSQVAVFFHCQTNLVESFRERYPELDYSGNRAILLDAAKKLPEAKLRHCVALALTYHLAKRKRM
jgi:hypothetical protein